LALYPDKSASIFKEHLRADRSGLSEFLQNYEGLKSKVYVAHVRFASKGSVAHENTHPFSREIWGREVTFAHNGTLSDFAARESPVFMPIGDTDSEGAFCHLLNMMREDEIRDLGPSNGQWFVDKLKTINRHGKLNCIITDGIRLLCYHDINGYNGLSYVKREAPFSTVMVDDDFEVDLAKEKDPSTKGFVVATRPLTNEAWTSFHPGELIIFEDGEMKFSSHQTSDSVQGSSLSDLEISIIAAVKSRTSRVTMSEIIDSQNESEANTKEAVLSLLRRGYFRQEGRYRVTSDNSSATFYTEPAKRQEIHDLLVRRRT
jgi:glutamine amidotransferase